MTTITKGQRVTVTGEGRTARWDRYIIGTVTRITKQAVFVRWDGTSFEDEMSPQEVRPC